MLSVITPTNNTAYLADAYDSLKAQSYRDWEWIVLVNGDCSKPEFQDDRVRVIEPDLQHAQYGIGALKHLACKAATGEVVVELDHDDLLTPDALQRISHAFDNVQDASLVYSNCARVNEDWSPSLFDPAYGWQYRERVVLGRTVAEVISPEPWPQNLSRIWFAPDHVRAWRASDYWKIGGHDPRLDVADDHDLVCRFYLHGKIHHIDDCLYIYRVHPSSTSLVRNPEVQARQWTNYERYIFPMAEKWAHRRRLLKIDLGGGIDKPSGYISVDRSGGEIVSDLNQPWPLADSTVGVIRAYDILEHLADPIHVMNEAHRVLAHGGFLMIMVPSTDGRGAFQDPTHVSFWNENSFWYYTRSRYQRYIGNRAQCRFQPMRIRTFAPDSYSAEHEILYTEAHLIAIKETGPRFHGLLEI